MRCCFHFVILITFYKELNYINLNKHQDHVSPAVLSSSCEPGQALREDHPRRLWRTRLNLQISSHSLQLPTHSLFRGKWFSTASTIYPFPLALSAYFAWSTSKSVGSCRRFSKFTFISAMELCYWFTVFWNITELTLVVRHWIFRSWHHTQLMITIRIQRICKCVGWESSSWYWIQLHRWSEDRLHFFINYIIKEVQYQAAWNDFERIHVSIDASGVDSCRLHPPSHNP